MSGRFVALCTVGLLGSLFVGYCVYFDRKRRSDPDYKKKVLARRKATSKKSEMIDLRDPKVKEEFLMGEINKANQKMAEGNIQAAVGHFINFIHFSGNPQETLVTLQQTLPPPLFNLIVRAYVALQTEGRKMQGASGTSAKKEEHDID